MGRNWLPLTPLLRRSEWLPIPSLLLRRLLRLLPPAILLSGNCLPLLLLKWLLPRLRRGLLAPSLLRLLTPAILHYGLL